MDIIDFEVYLKFLNFLEIVLNVVKSHRRFLFWIAPCPISGQHRFNGASLLCGIIKLLVTKRPLAKLIATCPCQFHQFVRVATRHHFRVTNIFYLPKYRHISISTRLYMKRLWVFLQVKTIWETIVPILLSNYMFWVTREY